MLDVIGYAAEDPRSPLRPYRFQRRDPGPRDVVIDIAWCGICHSDLHQVRNEWSSSSYPMVPGHEIVGRVAAVGSEVTRLRPGDQAAVGCMVASCRRCPSCAQGLEQYCEVHTAWTYNGTEMDLTTPTQGGYASRIVVDEHFALSVRGGLPLERVAPLLCAGITTWSPLRHWRVGPGRRVAVVGLGGLGHMAVQLAAALGAEVTVLSGSAAKRADALRLGAHELVVTTDEAAMKRLARRFDLVLDTAAAVHALDRYLALLARDGTLVLVGAPDGPLAVGPFALIPRRLRVAGSLIGGIAETQEMLDFCAERGIGAQVEVIAARDVNQAFERLLRGEARYRFVIDTTTL